MQCPICLQTIPSKPLATKENYTIYHCIACDVVFSDPMKALSRTDYEEMHDYRIPPPFYTQNHFKRMLFFYDHWNWKQFLKTSPANARRLLDVGCFSGEFLSIAVRARDWKVSGIDFNREAIEWSREHYGLDLYAMTIEDFIRAYPERRFDAITFFEVLEHLEKPNEFINCIKELLAPNGYIALSVPNKDETLAVLAQGSSADPPHHLTGWSVKALRNFLIKHNFEILVLKEKPIGIFFGSEPWGLLSTKFYAVKLKTKLNSALDRLKENSSLKNRFCVHALASIDKFKNRILRIVSIPLSIALRMRGYKGMAIYVLARLKD